MILNVRYTYRDVEIVVLVFPLCLFYHCLIIGRDKSVSGCHLFYAVDDFIASN